MAYRLFQNSNKTQPITEAGVSVGYSERKQGTVDALQATTLSKPILGRWPRTGLRNLAHYSANPTINLFWLASVTTNGITFTKLASGIEDGLPYVDYRLVGTAAGTVFISISDRNRVSYTADKLSMRLIARRLSGDGDFAGLDGIRFVVQRYNVLNEPIGAGSASTLIGNNTSDTQLSFNVVRDTDPAVSYMQAKIEFRISSGVTLDHTWRIKGVQVEEGESLTTYQANYGPNNITEPGVEDEWFLYNDGNDSLNTQPLQSGDFSVTSVDIYGNMDNKPSSGGSINSLVKERQRDVIVRSPPLIPSELEQVQAYWKAKGYKTEWSPLLLMSTQTDGHWSRGYNPNID